MLFLSRLAGHRLLLTLAICLALSLVAGCAATTVPVSATPDAIVREVKRGDVVNIVTKDDQSLRFSVEKTATARLSGEGYSVPYDQISEIAIEKKKRSESKAGYYAIVVFASLAALAATWAFWQWIDSETDKAVTGS